MTSAIPLHLSEDVFRRHEGYLLAAERAWPEDAGFEVPTGYAPSTFVARLRDARLSFITYSWQSSLNVVWWRETYAQTMFVIERDGRVWFRRRQPRGRPPVHVTPEQIVTQSPSPLAVASPLVWPSATEDELRALCCLLHSRKLSGPFLIAGNAVSDDFRGALTTLFDVGITFDPEKNQTIIM